MSRNGEDDRDRSGQRDPEEADWGQVAGPFDNDEEAKAALQVWCAEHEPPATDEEVARARRLAEIAERNRLRLLELIRQERAQDSKHGLPTPKEPTER
jgi:hypothetical protein